MTDQDGDKITGKFVCIGTLPSCDGEQRLDVGGTGKYEGMKAQKEFEFTFVGTTGHGVSLVHDGIYTIPYHSSRHTLYLSSAHSEL